MTSPSFLASLISRARSLRTTRRSGYSQVGATLRKRRIRSARRRLVTELLEDRRVLATFVVTTTADAGAGSLRQAIIDANTTAGADTINFSIGGGGPQTIAPITALPTITEAVQILGNSQPGFLGTPLIELRGDGVTVGNPISNFTGITIDADSVTVQSLAINRFANDGILVNSGTATLIQNYIGTDRTGTTDLGNNGSGIFMTASTSSSLISNNLISGNDGSGIVDLGSGTTITGNLIGTSASGLSALANSQNGISLVGSGATVGGTLAASRNIISGNSGYGVSLVGVSVIGNTVLGNYIGLNKNGDAAVPNANDGIAITSPNNTIGGTSAGARNVISGNALAGVLISGNLATGNSVLGNYIGTNAAGNLPIGNSGDGVNIVNASGNRIGSGAAGEAI